MTKYTISDLNRDFPNEAACFEYVVSLLYPDGITCRKCKKLRPHHKLTGRPAMSCGYCRTQVHPLAGTIFERTRTPLKHWLYAIYLMASTRCGISAKQLERELGVTYKTAWRMFHEVRKLLDDSGNLLTGKVEMDETYYGGEVRGRGKGFTGNKTLVIGAVQRGGDVRTGKGKRVSHAEIKGFMAQHVSPEVEMIFTDEHPTYKFLDKTGRHEVVAHKREEWVRGDAHTNSVEGFWSLTKRGIDGVYHSVSLKHLQSYLNEYAFRYNRRFAPTPMFTAMAERISEVRLGELGRYNPIGD